MDRNYEPITIKNAQLFKTNFSGKEIPPYNPAGKRTFCVFVEVSFNNRPPKIVIRTRNVVTRLEEEDVNMLDWAEKTNVDLSINPRYWEDGKDLRIKAYLRSMKVDIYEDEIEAEVDELYRNAPGSAVDAMVEEYDN